jgi:putative phosphoesterase
MRIAALYDIHGNLPALEAVLKEIESAQVDRIVIGGDVIPGPIPDQTIDRLLSLDCTIDFILGNGEVAVLQQRAGAVPCAVPPSFRSIIQWTAEQLRADHETQLRSWPATLRIESQTLGRLLICHATPRNENEIFTRLTPDSALMPIFGQIDADVVVCGHTHMQFDRIIGNTRVVNAGSVGMPFGSPGAYWLLMDTGIQLRCTNYDLEAAAAQIRQTGYPQADQFATNSILNPPAEQQTLQAYSKAELL